MQEEVDTAELDLSQAIKQLKERNYIDEDSTKIDIIDKYVESDSCDYENEIRNGLFRVINKKDINENDIFNSICNEIKSTTESNVIISNDINTTTSGSIIISNNRYYY